MSQNVVWLTRESNLITTNANGNYVMNLIGHNKFIERTKRCIYFSKRLEYKVQQKKIMPVLKNQLNYEPTSCN